MIKKIIVLFCLLCLWALIGLEAIAIIASLLAGSSFSDLLGQALFQSYSNYLNLLQAVVQRYLFPSIWEWVFVAALLRSIWINVLATFVLSVVSWILWRFAFSAKRRRTFF